MSKLAGKLKLCTDREMKLLEIQNVNDLAKGIGETINKIHDIYKKHDGEPNPKPEIRCFNCGKPIVTYNCAWDYNKHVSFMCPHCKISFMT